MSDYKNGKVYKLVNKEKNLVYIGSTIQTLRRRYTQHKNEAKYKNMSSYRLFEDGGIVTIELLEDYPCETKKELFNKEKEYIKNMDCVNLHIPNRTFKEYYRDNYEVIKKKSAEYHQKNKIRINEKRRKLFHEVKKQELLAPVLCPCGVWTSKQHHLRHERTPHHQEFIKSQNS